MILFYPQTPIILTLRGFRRENNPQASNTKPRANPPACRAASSGFSSAYFSTLQRTKQQSLGKEESTDVDLAALSKYMYLCVHRYYLSALCNAVNLSSDRSSASHLFKRKPSGLCGTSPTSTSVTCRARMMNCCKLDINLGYVTKAMYQIVTTRIVNPVRTRITPFVPGNSSVYCGLSSTISCDVGCEKCLESSSVTCGPPDGTPTCSEAKEQCKVQSEQTISVYSTETLRSNILADSVDT